MRISNLSTSFLTLLQDDLYITPTLQSFI